MLERTLENGLKVIVDENHAAKVVAAQVWVRVGSADEREGEFGLAHVHEHMLFKGTEKRKVGEIASDIEAAGGDINAWTSYDQTVYHVTIASRELDVALDILADAVQHSVFDEAELSRELEVVLEELRRGNDTPSRVASEMLFDLAYSAHPYRRPVIGFVDSVKSFTRDGILAFYRRWYQPRNMCLVVAGDVSADDVVAKAEHLFERSLNTGNQVERPRREEPKQTEIRSVTKAQDIQETYIGAAWHGPALAHEDTPALDVLAILLGTGESSRLYRRVKREQELVADCYAYSYTPQDAGLVMIGGQVQGTKVEEAFEALLTETLRLRYEAPTVAEVEKARTIILSEAVYQKETVDGIARKLGYFELVAGGTSFEERYYAAVAKVTSDDVVRVARKYLDPKAMSVATLLALPAEGSMTKERVLAITESVTAALEKEHSPDRIQLGSLAVARVRLPSGSTLLVCKDDTVPRVSIRAVSKGGLLAETPRTNGISHLVGELIVRGTDRYSAEQIVDETDAMAGGIAGISGRNSLGLRGDFLSASWERGFELFASCLLEPTFPEAEVEKEKRNQIEDIMSRRDNLSAVAFDQLGAALYGDHPFGMPTLGTKESVQALTRDDALAAFRAQLRPDQLTIAIVGAVDVPRTVDMVVDRIGHARVPDRIAPRPSPSRPTAPPGPRYATTLREKEQAHLVLGFLGVTFEDPRRYVLEVLSSVLGGQSGRLFLELRDKQSMAYSVGAFCMEGIDPGYFAVYIGTSPEKLERAENGIRAELSKILDEEIAEGELARARRYLIGAHEISLQRASARCSTMALNEAYGVGYDDHAKYADRILGVRAKDVRDVARDIVRLDAAVRSVVTPAR
jgi:zinc protease